MENNSTINNKIPQLRFPGFTGEWQEKKLNEVFSRVTRKNAENNQNVLTISAQYGLISQLEFFKKSVASSDVTGYYLLHKGEFAYNKSSSQGRPVGAIKPLRIYDKGVVSTLYICFKCNNPEEIDFWEQYFDAGILDSEILSIAQEGARNHGLLNISTGDFFGLNVILPTPPEMKKIAECLSSFDDVITAAENELDSLKAHKKGLMQQLFPQPGATTPALRFPGFTGEWQEKPLSHFLHEHKTKSDGKCEVHSVSVTRGVINQVEYLGRSFAASDTSKYNLAKPGDIIYTKSPTGAFPYGIVKQNKNPHNVIVSPLYAVYTPMNQYVGYILDSFFESSVNTNNYLSSLIQKGAKNTIQISNDTFVSKSMCLPSNSAEQQKIAECLESLDSLIAAETKELEFLKIHKKGLMQQLFPQLQK